MAKFKTMETRTGFFTLREDGIVHGKIAKARQTLEDAKTNMDTVLQLSGEDPAALLIDVRESLGLDADVRHFYFSLPLSSFTGLAMITPTTPLGTVMGNIYLAFHQHRVPTRIFRNENEALLWLRAKTAPAPAPV